MSELPTGFAAGGVPYTAGPVEAKSPIPCVRSRICPLRPRGRLCHLEETGYAEVVLQEYIGQMLLWVALEHVGHGVAIGVGRPPVYVHSLELLQSLQRRGDGFRV